MAGGPIIQTNDLEGTFNALRNQDPSKLLKRVIPYSADYKPIPNQNYAPTTSVSGAFGGGMYRYASTSANAGMIYGQPQFFSPVHTPINWQIPSKRLEQYQWARFFYENEPKVASSIDFYSCFEPDMQVLMADGTQKAIAEIKIGDIVRSHDGSINAVTNKFERHAVEEMLKLKIAGLSIGPLRCTKDHRILTEKDGKIDFVKAEDLKEGDYLLTPVEYESNFSIDNDLSWLIGVYAAEGCGIPYEHESKKGKIVSKFKGVYFSLSYEERETFALTIKQKLQKLYGTNSISIISNLEHGNCVVAAYGEDIADDLCGLCPGMSKNGSKRFSPLVMQLNNENLKYVLAGFVTGDGCFNKSNGFQGVGVSKKLCEQIANICDRLGIEYSFTETRLSKTDRQTCYNVRISRRACKLFEGISYKYYENTAQEDNIRNTPYFKKGKFIYRKIYKIKPYQYDGLVYDLEVSGVHTYVVNRISVHNCFPMNGFDNECKDRKVKKYFDKLCERLDLEKWLRLISHEVHLLGDCFPFIEIGCEHCGGSGKIGDQLCEHEGGTVRRVVILNPDYVDVYTSPINPVPVIALKPDEELINMVQKKTPGFERLTPEVRALVASGRPIPLDNRNIFHLKYGEGGYTRYGVGMVRRLFPILSYKTKLMVAQWIVAERLIVPIRIVKVGSDERPAGPSDIAAVQQQLAQTANDPNLTIVTHNAFDIDFIGASGKVLTLSNEFEFINQEILDGMMINNALLNGEGPTFSNAAVGIEAMIERLQTFRREISNWIEQKIYLPEAKRQGFIDKNSEDTDSDEEEYIYPRIKWHSMHLRDQQQHRTFVLQLYEKGLLSAQTVLETFDFDPDQEIERKRYDAVQMMALGQGMGEMGMGAPGGGQPGGAGGGDMGGGFGGMPPMPGGEAGGGGGLPGMGGGEAGGGGAPPISAPGGGGAPAMSTSKTSFAANTTDIANPTNYGGKVLKERTREKMDMQKQKMFKQREMASEKSINGEDVDAWDMPGMRDAKGRIVFTKPERELMQRLSEYRKNGLIKYPILPQYAVQFGSTEYPIDFAIPHLKLGIEADGEIFHSSPKQLTHDKERDMKLAQAGWTILRFTDGEIDKQLERVMSTIIKSIMQKESLVNSQKTELK